MAQRREQRSRKTTTKAAAARGTRRAPSRGRGTPEAIRDTLIRRVDRTFRRGNWAASGPMTAIEGVTADVAHHRHPGEHTVAESVLHMAYWKDAVTAYLRDEPWRYDDAMNWRPAEPGEAGWEAAKVEFARAHRRLLAALRTLPVGRLLERVRPDRPWQLIDLVVDVATHDTYHAAQIFILKRLAARSAPITS